MVERKSVEVSSLPVYWSGLFGAIMCQRGRNSGEDVDMFIYLFVCKGSTSWIGEGTFSSTVHEYVARRGRPQLIISDNAPQFKLVQTVLDREWSKVFIDEEVLSFLSQEGIVWKFTTALAPWLLWTFSGFSEAKFKEVYGKEDFVLG